MMTLMILIGDDLDDLDVDDGFSDRTDVLMHDLEIT